MSLKRFTNSYVIENPDEFEGEISAKMITNSEGDEIFQAYLLNSHKILK
jgi:t-SNARE complex subunit (syntaxin)